MGASCTILGPLATVLALGALALGCSAPGADGSGAPTSGDPDDIVEFSVTSAAFAHGDEIPLEFCRETFTGGRNVSPPLAWSEPPAGTRSFAVTMIDRHPVARQWIHWAVVDIPPDARMLTEGASAGSADERGGADTLPSGARELENTFGSPGYGGPAPPPGTGEHTYAITVHALDVATIAVGRRPTAGEFEGAIAGHVLARATIAGVLGQ